ncbi:MAG: hypothetical protein LBP96_03950, partial [Bacteroidales bacterium]|nr:hypothetical protein [Bacteroidales bacterium]
MKSIITIFFAIILSFGGFAQQRQQARSQQQTRQPSKEQLQEQAKRLETQIQNNNKLLEEASKNRAANVTQVNILNTQIGQRDQLIRTINGEISAVN